MTSVKIVAYKLTDDGADFAVYDSGYQTVDDQTVSALTQFIKAHLAESAPTPDEKPEPPPT